MQKRRNFPLETPKMNGFIDLHTHILPGVDDGATDMSQSLKLLRMAWEDGTRTVVLTPHYRGKYKSHTPDDLRQEFSWLQEMARQELPGMRLYLGQEISYELDAPEAMHKGRVLTMNDSQYVLLEFKTNSLRSQIITGVNETINHGFTPIVAHVERYDISRKDPSLVDELFGMGALLQLNADSVMGANGFGVKIFCHRLLKKEKVHFIASDAHDAHYCAPLLRDCFLRVYKKYGKEYAVRLFHENAKAVIENRNIE
jgi:protein-tyrosine phosphatase